MDAIFATLGFGQVFLRHNADQPPDAGGGEHVLDNEALSVMLSRIGTLILAALVTMAGSDRAVADPGCADYTAWVDWARLRVGTQAGLASSYDRGGENFDFSQYEWPEGLVLEEVVATVKTIPGPGVIYRFWMPHLTANRIFDVRMYFDDEPTPRIDTTSDVLFAGAFSFFAPPLVDTCAGGQVCYEPIPFAQSLRIETVNHELPAEGWSAHRNYYQYSYLAFPQGTALESYSGSLSPQQQAARDETAALFTNAGQHPAGESQTAVVVTTPTSSIPGGQCLTLANLTGPGIIRRLNVRMDGASDDDLNGLHLLVTYDDQAGASIDVSVAEFFGAGNLRASYASLPLGTDSPDGSYCYWPIPFRESALVQLCNTTGLPIAIDSAVVEYEPGPLSIDMCYLHAEPISDVRAAGQMYHQILSATGRGHYVGNLLYIEQDAWSFSMLEGDEVIVVDGGPPLYGTGLEDAYNGGYYYNWVGVQQGEPEGSMPQSATRALNGILYVHRETGVEYARADQYRWYIGDRIPFSSSIDVKIENRYAIEGTLWTSVAFWYQQPPIAGDSDGDGDLDLVDYAAFQVCFADQSQACVELFDLDGNAQLDLADYAALVASASGPWQP
ncbi:MAG: DUF2961 domain-containing protein [Planctomycetota bacterium]